MDKYKDALIRQVFEAERDILWAQSVDAQAKGRGVGADKLEFLRDAFNRHMESRYWEWWQKRAQRKYSAEELADMLALAPGTAKDLAQKIDRDPSMVTRLLSLFKCIESVQAAAAAGKIGPKLWHELSQLDATGQAEQLAAKLAGASDEEVVRQSKKRRNGSSNGDTVEISRCRCLMPLDVTVTLAGEGLSLDQVIETLKDLLAEARKANDSGYNASTFTKMLADKNKAKASS